MDTIITIAIIVGAFAINPILGIIVLLIII
jgi:hypothetical protein